MSSELVGIGGVLIGLIAGFGLERLAESRRLKLERSRYLLERRDDAYLAWLAAVPQYATALSEWQRRKLASTGGGSRDEAPELKRVADDLHVNQVRPALNAVRLYGTPEVINDTRLAFKLLIKANRRCERGLTPSGEVDLSSYRVVFEICLQRMRSDVGSAAADERLDSGGRADLRTIDAEIDCEIAEQLVPRREPS